MRSRPVHAGGGGPRLPSLTVATQPWQQRMVGGDVGAESRYVTINRDEWAALRASTPLTLREEDLEQLRGINEQLSLDEVATIYLPLSRLLNLYVGATQGLHRASEQFLGDTATKVPFIIGMAGSVAVGKSTTARVFASCWPAGPIIRRSI